MREPIIQHRGAAMLQQLLQQLHRMQAQDIARRVVLGSDSPPDMTHWVQATANAVKPLLLRLTQAGAAQMAAKLGGKPAPVADSPRQYRVHPSIAIGGNRLSTSTSETGPVVSDDSILESTGDRRFRIDSVRRGWQSREILKSGVRLGVQYNPGASPKVLDAVDAASMLLARSTLATATGRLATAMTRLRAALKAGLTEGEAISELAARIQDIFASPSRAFAIAATEASRAVHGGQLLVAKEAGITRKEWVASSDACELCISIMEKGPVPIDEPFHVDAKGGHYAVCLHPPCHPHDMCTWNEVL